MNESAVQYEAAKLKYSEAKFYDVLQKNAMQRNADWANGMQTKKAQEDEPHCKYWIHVRAMHIIERKSTRRWIFEKSLEPNEAEWKIVYTIGQTRVEGNTRSAGEQKEIEGNSSKAIGGKGGRWRSRKYKINQKKKTHTHTHKQDKSSLCLSLSLHIYIYRYSFIYF